MLLWLCRMVLNLLPLGEVVETNSVWQDSRPLDKETHHSSIQAGDLKGSSNLSSNYAEPALLKWIRHNASS